MTTDDDVKHVTSESEQGRCGPCASWCNSGLLSIRMDPVVKSPTVIDVVRLTPTEVQEARRTIAAIFLCLRATKHARPATTPEAAQQVVRDLSPVVYHWHFLAWRMGGTDRGNVLARARDGRVVVISPEQTRIGDPMTDQVARVSMTPSHPTSAYRVH